MTETYGDKMMGRRVLGRYRIVRLLAQGGMGAVYLARLEGAAGFTKPVVVKLILPHLCASPDEQTQFIREAKILSELHHPGIVDVIDFGKEDNAYLMVLEYVHGYHLGQWLRYLKLSGERMPWEFAVFVMIQVLAALHHAHGYVRSDGQPARVIHRDISPSNILMDIDGHVRIVDFGVARTDAGRAAEEPTVHGVFHGKIPYAAPELFKGEKATPMTDVYACAVVLYQLLCGSNPFGASDIAAVLDRVINLVPPPISSLRNDVPRGLDEVLAKGLAKDAKQRYETAQDFAAELREHLHRTDSDIAAQLSAAVRKDFTGDLPKELAVTKLEDLDAAWRTVRDTSLVPLPSTRRAIRLDSMLEFPPTLVVKDVAAGPAEQAVVGATPISSRRLLLVAVAAALFAGGAAAAGAVLLTREPSRSSQARFLVVEANQAQSDASGPASSEPSAVALAESVASPSGAQVAVATSTPAAGPSGVSPAVHADPKPRDSGGQLSRVFAKRQGAIQSCFHANASKISGTPEVSIRFSVDEQGKVLSAAVRPTEIASTPLGQCLEAVARSTDFGPQEQALRFSIPITARAR